jgi:hypothetical protein
MIWIGSVCCGLTLGAWFASRWYWAEATVAHGSRTTSVRITLGQLWIMRFNVGRDRGWNVSFGSGTHRAAGLAPEWWWAVRWAPNPSARGRVIATPLWMPIVLVAVPTGVLWLRRSRRGQGECRNCGYDRSGLGATPCPECGAVAVSD